MIRLGCALALIPDQLCHRGGGLLAGAVHARRELNASTVDGGGAQRRHRLWPAGDRRQLRQRPDHPVRAPDPRRRHRHGGRHRRCRHQDPHPRHDHPQLGSQRAAGAEQGVRHRAAAELVAVGLDTTRPLQIELRRSETTSEAQGSQPDPTE